MERVNSPSCLKESLTNNPLKSFENASAPFTLDEYDAVWKDPKYYPWNFQQYLDFNVSTDRFLIPAPSTNPLNRSATSTTHRVSSRHFGKMTAPSTPSKQMVVRLRTSINMVIWRPSVFTRIGIVNCPNSLPSKIVSENGNRRLWTG